MRSTTIIATIATAQLPAGSTPALMTKTTKTA
jgi:hypothetical protein